MDGSIIRWITDSPTAPTPRTGSSPRARLFSGVLVAALFAASACSSDEPKASAVTFEQYFNSAS